MAASIAPSTAVRRMDRRMDGPRRPTATSTFGVGRRESHDAREFYARFTAPAVSTDDTIAPAPIVDELFCTDAREMAKVDDNSVALVVTSPPYFAGKEYEAVLGEGHVPATYVEYLELLHDTFAECVRVLEPGGRIAVNVANLGRKPYRSLSSDVIGILQDRLGLLLRGEIIWQKAQGAGGSCAWGSFRSPANPVLRDLTERVIVASKGRFDRAVSKAKRAKSDLPAEATITRDGFMEATTDVWEIAPERATRVGHPAPFPVELPQRLIELYTYRGDVVLDPFMGVGTTAVAALRTDRRYIGYEIDRGYLEASVTRIAAERTRLASAGSGSGASVPAVQEAIDRGDGAVGAARALLQSAGFDNLAEGGKAIAGVTPDITASDPRGRRWFFLVAGGLTTPATGLRRSEVLWRSLGRASALATSGDPVGLVTTDLPPRGSAGDNALRAVTGQSVHALVLLTAPDADAQLRGAARGGVE